MKSIGTRLALLYAGVSTATLICLFVAGYYLLDGYLVRGLDLLERKVTYQNLPLDMTSREFALLEVFLQNAGRILTRTLICEKVWESHYDIDGNLLDVYMSKLRGKFELEPAKPLFKTIRGVGYQMMP